ncbi:MAG: hypothetical protein IPO08_17105 [Xanthomonadales bacterium]|nr:hypothetical protein [Xanthomonadales bacterium]
MPNRVLRATWFWPDLVLPALRRQSSSCISQAGDGDSVVIVAGEVTNPNRYTLIDEDLTISQSISLSVGQVSTPCWRQIERSTWV